MTREDIRRLLVQADQWTRAEILVAPLQALMTMRQLQAVIEQLLREEKERQA